MRERRLDEGFESSSPRWTFVFFIMSTGEAPRIPNAFSPSVVGESVDCDVSRATRVGTTGASAAGALLDEPVSPELRRSDIAGKHCVCANQKQTKPFDKSRRSDIDLSADEMSCVK